MSDFSTDRLEPAARVPEAPKQQPRRETGENRRRVPPPAPPKPPQTDEAPNENPHQFDRLA